MLRFRRRQRFAFWRVSSTTPRQQVIRIDYAHREPINKDLYAKLKENIISACKGADAHYYFRLQLRFGRTGDRRGRDDFAAKENGIPMIIDSRFRLQEFPDAAAATPNQDEVEQILGKDFACRKLRFCVSVSGYKALLVTLGNKGMTLFEEIILHDISRPLAQRSRSMSLARATRLSGRSHWGWRQVYRFRIRRPSQITRAASS